MCCQNAKKVVNTKMLHTSDFDFELPNELIASHPLERRDSSRMLVIDNGKSRDQHIRDFISYLQPGDVVVFNNSRVIPARFDASGHEITLHTSVDDKNWWGLCKKFNKIKDSVSTWIHLKFFMYIRFNILFNTFIL